MMIAKMIKLRLLVVFMAFLGDWISILQYYKMSPKCHFHFLYCGKEKE
jgi:hypothetical protein